MASLLHSRKFWIAVFGLIQTILFQFVPDFPPAVWQSIDALVVVLITMIAFEDAAEKSGNTYVIQGSAEDVAAKISKLEKQP